MNSRLPRNEIVLLGVGHTNAHVLRMWRMAPIADARLTCVSDFSVATYSGMVPGALAGVYDPREMQIDLVRACAAAGARLVIDRPEGLDLIQRRLHFADRPAIPFDVLSIGVGSVPTTPESLAEADVLLPIKPMRTFLERFDARVAAWRSNREDNSSPVGKSTSVFRVAVLGAGAGGVEIALGLPGRLKQALGAGAFEITLIDRNPEILAGYPSRVIAFARAALAQSGVITRLGQSVSRAYSGGLRLGFADVSPLDLPVDMAIVATQAQAPAWLASLGLPTDERGFLAVRPTLQTVADAPVFVVGDSASCSEHPAPKAGVYAVRQGPILWENIGRYFRKEPLVPFVPQRGFLSLLSTGDRRAILSYKGFSARAGWCWKLKDRIDRRFMRMHQDYSPRMMAPEAPAVEAMRCAGCGGKVGGDVLSRVLARLEIPPSPHVKLGLDQPDDAAIFQSPLGRPVVATVDYFAAFLDDPYLVGRIAALNALSDAFALGAQPLAALAMATIPVGPARQQEQLLYELLEGALRELRASGATLMGGHTIEGPQTEIGFSVLADPGTHPPRLKGGLRPGDVLILTKPLGSGALLAAHARAACQAEWFDALLPILLTSNQAAAVSAIEFDAQGITDVTGFGLAGHLLEMTRASQVGAELDLASIPLALGFENVIEAGVESTLTPANRSAETALENTRSRQTHGSSAPWAARYAALFDPQTSGGLLLGAPEGKARLLLEKLRASQAPRAEMIGRVVSVRDAERPIRLM